MNRLGIGVGLGIGGRVYDPAAKALFDRFSSQPDSTRKGYINDLFKGLRADGNLSIHDAFWITAGHNQTDAKLNWMSSSYTLTEVNSPTFATDRGYTGNGSNMSLNTNYNPSTNGVNLTLNSSTLWIYFRNNVDGGGSNGVLVTHGLHITPRNTNLIGSRNNSSSAGTGSNTDSRGIISVQRTVSTEYKAHRNGTLLATHAISSTSVPNDFIYLLALNIGASRSNHDTNQIAAAGVGSGSINLSTLFTRIETYLDAIGAGVI